MSIDGMDLTGKDMHKGLTGQTAAEGAEKAAQLQYEASKEGIKSQEKFLKKTRKDLLPFKDAGVGQLPGLTDLISNPQAQLAFIQNNPFFKTIADDAQNRLMSVQAARGKLGSGDTPLALQNSLLMLGNDLVNQSITQRMNMATMGQNAAAMTGTATQNAGNTITDLITGGAASRAAGIVGAANAQSAGAQNMAALAGSIFLSDRRFKTDLKQVGEIKGIPIYDFVYAGGTQRVVGVMAQDVEPIVPGAVLDVFGVKFVDYSELERALTWH